MKSGKLIAMLIGGWLLFIGLDTAHGKIGKRGALYLAAPLKTMFNVTSVIRTILLFKIAVLTFLLIARQLISAGGKKDENGGGRI